MIGNAASRGVTVSENEAVAFLGAKELLAHDSDHRLAREVVENFTKYIATGKKPWSFAEFMLPDLSTDEERAQMKAAR